MPTDQHVALQDPMINADAVTPSDTVDLARGVRGLYVGVSGDVQVTMLGQAPGGKTVVLGNLAAGIIHRMRITRVWDTNTDSNLEIVAFR